MNVIEAAINEMKEDAAMLRSIGRTDLRMQRDAYLLDKAVFILSKINWELESKLFMEKQAKTGYQNDNQ